jgi:hypothetical protein
MRRPDLEIQTRIEIATLGIVGQDQYGAMTRLAQDYDISRTFLYQLVNDAKEQLEEFFSPKALKIPDNPTKLDQWILLLRLEGRCSILAISVILTMLGYFPCSVGYISIRLQAYGVNVPSTLTSSSPVDIIYVSDEIFAISDPILITIDPKSTAILKIELALDRTAETWEKHFKDLQLHQFYTLGLCSDGGLGLTAGYDQAFPGKPWYSDHFHEFQDVTKLLIKFEKQAYAAINQEAEAAGKFDHAKSDKNLKKRLEQWERATNLCHQKIALYDNFFILSNFLFCAIHFFDSLGKPRYSQIVQADLETIFDLMQALNHPEINKVVATLRNHLQQIVRCYQELETVYKSLSTLIPDQNALDFLCLAWHHDHTSHQVKSATQRYHQNEADFWLNCAQPLLKDPIDQVKKVVFERLDSIIRASSLVEMVNSLIRPYLNSCKGQITQESLNLIMFYHNHRPYKSGRRKGMAPIEILTCEPLKQDWLSLLLQKNGQTLKTHEFLGLKLVVNDEIDDLQTIQDSLQSQINIACQYADNTLKQLKVA